MTNTASAPQRSRLSIWLQALRPFSYTASVIPAMYATAYAVYLDQPIRWVLFVPVVLASLSIHAATNLVSEYFDYVKGVDRPETLGGSRVLVEGLLRPVEVLAAGLILFAVTAGFGLVFIFLRGWPIFVLGVVGMAGGIFYTAAPLGLKYRGLGDLTVFWMMGPLMVIGGFYVLTGHYMNIVLTTSLPIGCLVAGILSGNNLRDIPHDARAGIKTTAGVLQHHWAKAEYIALIITAYLIVIITVLLRQLPLWSLLVFLTLPPAMKNIRSAAKSSMDRPEQIAALDVQTAQLHLLFGIVLIVSLLLGRFWP